MSIEDFRFYCLSKKGVVEEFPFGNQTIVFKVGKKIFALADVDEFKSFNVKCDPEEAILLREAHSFVIPGYHMNKKHWNTVYVKESLNSTLLYKWIDDSYALVFNNLPLKEKKIIENS